MPPLKTCRVIVRTDKGNRIACGIRYTGEFCPERQDHLKAMPTGWCNSGWHEGTKAKSYSGKPAPSCQKWETCPCTCHDDISKMFAMAERERILVNNSDYSGHSSEFIMPTAEERIQWAMRKSSTSNGDPVHGPIVLESPAPGIVPASMVRSFAPTSSGRTAKGELEIWVNRVCGIWVVENYKWPCTPSYIAEKISEQEGISPPSTGAIAATFKRWEELGYAVIGSKPNRFVSYTPLGIELGLDVMKDKDKRRKAHLRSLREKGIKV